MKRREFLQLSFGTAAVAALPSYAQSRSRAEGNPDRHAEGRLLSGGQGAANGGKDFTPLGIDVKWIDFQFGPPLLEAINVGSVDFGYVGIPRRSSRRRPVPGFATSPR